jgi:hypothetical protein
VSAQPIQRRQVRDLLNNELGEVMDENTAGTCLFLRPVGGGVEREVPLAMVQDLVPHQDGIGGKS